MKAIAVVFHPLLMPTYTFAILVSVTPQVLPPMGWALLPFITLSTFLTPSLGVLVLRVSGSISSIAMAERQERYLPLLFASIFYTVSTVMFMIKIQADGVASTMLISTTVLILVLMVITWFYKVSIHSAGVSGVLGFLTVIYMSSPTLQLKYAIATALIISGLVMTARLFVNAHTPKQVLLGWVIGFVICFSGLFFFG